MWGLSRAAFIAVSGLSSTVPSVTSEPVPAVVGMAMTGRTAAVTGLALAPVYVT